MSRIALILILVFAFTGCWEVGGANQQQSIVGNSDTGNAIGYQVSISPDGRHLVAIGADGAHIYAVDLTTLASTPIAVSAKPSRMVFGADDRAYFVTLTSDETTVVERASLTTGRRVGHWDVPVGGSFVAYDPASDRLAFWSWFSPLVHVLDPNTNDIVVLSTDRGVNDARWLRSGELAVVSFTDWRDDAPVTKIRLYGATLAGSAAPAVPEFGAAYRELEVPNCSSQLVVSPTDDIALLAPVDCKRDPVSVIDLARAAFVQNLPGFGPVAFSPDGQTAIAFGRQAELATLGITTETPFSLLFIAMRDLSIEALDIGDSQPIYQLTPDGQVVLIYSVFESADYDGIYLIDIASRTIRETQGPEVPLREFVITPDSELVYLIEGGLYRLDVSTGRIAYVQLECTGRDALTRCNPELINMLPDGATLVLGWRNDPEFALFDVPTERVTRTFVVGGRPSPVSLSQQDSPN